MAVLEQYPFNAGARSRRRCSAIRRSRRPGIFPSLCVCSYPFKKKIAIYSCSAIPRSPATKILKGTLAIYSAWICARLRVNAIRSHKAFWPTTLTLVNARTIPRPRLHMPIAVARYVYAQCSRLLRYLSFHALPRLLVNRKPLGVQALPWQSSRTDVIFQALYSNVIQLRGISKNISPVQILPHAWLVT